MGVREKWDPPFINLLDKMPEPILAFNEKGDQHKNKAFIEFFGDHEIDLFTWFDNASIKEAITAFFNDRKVPASDYISINETISGDLCRINWTFEEFPLNKSLKICLAKVKSHISISSLVKSKQKGEQKGLELLRNIDFIQSILRNSHDMLALIDINGVYKFVSTAIIEKLGVLPEHIIGKSYKQFKQEGFLEFENDNFEELLTSKEEININFWVNRPDGKRIFIESFGKNLLDDPIVDGFLFSARDITEFVEAKNSLQKRYELENLINKISAKFVNAGFDRVGEVFKESLAMLGNYEKADRAFIFLVHEEIQEIENVYEWTAEGIDPQIDNLKNISTGDSILLTLESLKKGEILVIPDVARLPDEFEYERSLYLAQGILSVLLIPIFSENRMIGFFGLDAVKEKRDWNEKDEYVLRQLGDIYAGSFINQSFKKRLDRNESLLAETEILAKTGSWLYSNSKKRVIFSRGLNKIFELDDELYALRLKDFLKKIEKNDRKLLLINLRKAYDTLSSVVGELGLHLEEGKVKYISYRIQVRPIPGTRKLEIFGYCSDITAKKDAENYLRLQSQVLAQVFDPIFVTDEDFRIIYMNKAAVKECGIEPEIENQGSVFDYYSFLMPEGEDFHQLIRNLGLNQAFRREMDLKLRNGQIDNFEVSIQPFLNDQREKLGYSFLLRNRSLLIKQEALAKKAKLIVENSPAVLFTVDPNDRFKILYISENIRQFGYDAAELISDGVPITDLIHPDDLTSIMKYYQDKTSEKGIPAYSGEYRLRRSDGTYRWVEDESTEIHGQNKHIQFHEGLIQDITDKKRDRDEIIRSQERYRVLAANIPLTSIFLIDKNLKYIVAEGTTFESWGMTSSDFEGKIMSQVNGMDFQDLQPEFLKALEKKAIIKKILTLHHRIYEIIIRPILYRGEVEYALGILRDINEEFQAKEDLKKNEEKYRKLVEESTEIIYSLSQELEIDYVSPNLIQFLGYDYNFVIGKRLTDFLHPDDLKIVEYNIALLNTTENQYLEFRLQHKNGEYRIFSSNVKFVKNEELGRFYYTGIARDITNLKEAQRELFYAKEKAEQASIIKSQFLSIMSHEIRTPMNAVIGMSHLLIEDNPRPDQLENLKTLQFSAENLLGLINDILDFSKIDSGKIELEKVTFELNAVFNRILHSYTYQAREKSLEIIFESDDKLPELIVGDPVRLSQVINNLVSNAIKFTEKGYVKISLKKIDEDDDTITINFNFEDTGIGIPEDKAQSVFEAFTQASTETTRKYGGTGLGLAIVKRLVELFGAEITLTRKKTGGTIFNFSVVFEKHKIQLSSPVKNYSAIDKSLGNAVILVAEDNIVNQLMIKKFLTKWGVKVVVIADDGLEAISAVEKEAFNLILLDLQMPGKDGFEVSHYIRQMNDPIKNSVPIIAMTASSLINVKEQLDEVGMNDYISKPFNPEDLYAKIIKYLKA
jgi:PAS domain S-box-containing protein